MPYKVNMKEIFPSAVAEKLVPNWDAVCRNIIQGAFGI
jgi:hypothetical protein